MATTEGQRQVRALAADADVLIENFKVGGLARYGLDAESMRALNPRLIYCSITGFGQTGPYAHRPGYDFIVQGMGGMMSITGEPDGPPQKSGVAYADILTGVIRSWEFWLPCSSESGPGGRACRHGAARHAGWRLGESGAQLDGGGKVPHRMVTATVNLVPYQSFACADGE